MTHQLLIYLLLIPVFAGINMLWLGVVMTKFYEAERGALARRRGENLSPI